MSYKMSFMYIAGFFDGEGSIYKCCEGNIHYQIRIAQKPITVLKIIRIFLLRHDIESTIYLNKKDQCNSLLITSRINQALFLNRILPYLIVKRDQAEECLEWIKNCNEKGHLHILEKRKIKELINLGFTHKRIGKEIDRPIAMVQRYSQREGLLN